MYISPFCFDGMIQPLRISNSIGSKWILEYPSSFLLFILMNYERFCNFKWTTFNDVDIISRITLSV